MKRVMTIFIFLLSLILTAEVLKPWKSAVLNLTPEEKAVIVNKGTEMPFSGKYVNSDDKGIYRCKVCGAALFRSNDKFKSHCGWPSFDDAIPGAVKKLPDADGHRVEIVCARCGAHLGHIFEGEGFTPKNTRYCVNSISLKFQKEKAVGNDKYRRAYFAGGCFWGVEYYMEKLQGVKEVISGYMGGSLDKPSYRDVSTGKTGHYEVVEVIYNPSEISYKELAKIFFEIHDPTQREGQGPDIGAQYRSAIFVGNEKEKRTVEKLISILKHKGYDVQTKMLPAKKFYKAEKYHQDYYKRHGKEPYCHTRIKRF